MVLFTLFFTLFTIGRCEDLSYYWREYHGTSPSDAFVAGTNRNGNKLYVGQVYEHYSVGGLIPVQINENATTVYALSAGPHPHTKYIKILCGDQDRFKWIPSSDRTVANDVRGKKIVFGGYNVKWGDFMVARVEVNGEHRIGKMLLVSWQGTPRVAYYSRNGHEVTSSTYEFLVYEEPETGIHPRINFY